MFIYSHLEYTDIAVCILHVLIKVLHDNLLLTCVIKIFGKKRVRKML